MSAEFGACGHCGREERDAAHPDGFRVVRDVGMGLKTMISCPCGILTKLCFDDEELAAVWNSRPGAVKEPRRARVYHRPGRALARELKRIEPQQRKRRERYAQIPGGATR